MGAVKNREYARFYKVARDKGNDSIILSSEITPKYNSAGDVVSGTYKSRNHSTWFTNICFSKSMYALIRRRAEDKRLQEKEISFVRWVTFIMPIWEYNVHFKKLKSMSRYLLQHTKFIIHYNIDQSIEDIVLKPHGNSKSRETFRPTMHSVIEDCKAKVQNDSRLERYIIDDFENAENFFRRETDSVVPRNPRQIYKFQQNFSKNKTKDDDVLDIIVEMLNQAKDSSSFLSPMDHLFVSFYINLEDNPYLCSF